MFATIPVRQGVILGLDQGVVGSVDEIGRAFSIFISYRRDDTGHAADRIAERLRDEFGEHAVYRDLSQPPGTAWCASCTHAATAPERAWR
jgi:hypothetical protein